MSVLRDWISGVTAAAIILSAVLALTPEGTVKKTVRLAGGLVMLIAVVSPFRSLNISDISFFTQQYRADYENYEEKLIFENSAMVKLIIEDKTRTYILQKAGEFGIDCDVEVMAKTAEAGYPYPVQVTIIGALSEAEKDKLGRFIKAELGVQNQIWMENSQ